MVVFAAAWVELFAASDLACNDEHSTLLATVTAGTLPVAISVARCLTLPLLTMAVAPSAMAMRRRMPNPTAIWVPSLKFFHDLIPKGRMLSA